MASVTGWLRARRGVATITAIAIIAAVPVTFAVLHPGFPVSDVDLSARDVWVTNGKALLAGRLNRQIEELDASVPAGSGAFDVAQDGETVVVFDSESGTADRVDPSFATLGQHLDIPVGSEVELGGDSLVVHDPNSGKVWIVDAAAELTFDSHSSEPIVKLGKGGHIAVSRAGTVFASDPAKKKLWTVPGPGGEATSRPFDVSAEHQLSAVGETPVALDESSDELVTPDRAITLPSTGIRLQQPGDENSFALVSSASDLLEVPLGGGDVKKVDAQGKTSSEKGVAAPVWVEGCAHAAWAGSQRYLADCAGSDVVRAQIPDATAASNLVFRVNRDVVALNDLVTGSAWLVDADMRLVENWDEVTPPKEEEGEEGDEKSSTQSFEDTLAERTPVNRPPLARDDTFGVRPGASTILPILDNDTDPDGDVLTVTRTGAVAASQGRLELIDGGRALQFTPAEGARGTTSFRYTVSDGRPGGIAEAQVNVGVHPAEVNEPPVAHREGAVSVEQGQVIGYNVLADWSDPDGDDLYLVTASSTSGDGVRFAPDGYITFEHRSAELGKKQVNFTVSDGTTSATGVLTVDVKAAGSLNPVGTPDFARTIVGQTVSVSPLENDLTPSGKPLELLGIQEVPAGLTATPNLDNGSISFSSTTAGSYILIYSLGAGAASSVGLIRIDVDEPPTDEAPPIAVKDVAYLRAGAPTSVAVLTNDVSPSGRVLAVQAVDASAAGDLVSVELLTNAVVRITASEALTTQLQIRYTVSDGVGVSSAGITIVPVAPLIKHQPPVAVDDRVRVRAGDISTVHVLANDYHPDSAVMHLAPELVDTSAAGGLVFVSGDDVRYEAPKAPGDYSATYRVVDDVGENAVATVRFTVVAAKDDNQPPTPAPLTVRTFAGSAVQIDVPLDGTDPDGDSVYLTGISSSPQLGRIVKTDSEALVYEPYPGASGTDTFTYKVEDALGAAAEGTIRVGVIPRAAELQPPNAVDDTIKVEPGRTVSVPVWRNDSDPNGYSLSVSKKLLDVDKGLKAKVKSNRVIVEVPETEGTYVIRYQISNGHGGVDTAFLSVIATPDADPLYPSSIDQVLEKTAVVGKSKIDVDVLDGAENPGGLIDDLEVTLTGDGADAGEVLPGGRVQVHPGDKRQVIAYQLTNPVDENSTTSFIVVPAQPRDPKDDEKAEQTFPPPFLKAMPPQLVRMNGTISWKVGDIVEVPSGKPALVLSASASNSDGSAVDDGSGTLTYTPAKDFRGPAAVTFTVTDGTSASDPKGRTALLTIPVTVGDPNFEDVPPTFTPPSIKIEAGEDPTTIDLRDSTAHANPALLPQMGYRGVKDDSSDIDESLSGSSLTISAPLGVQPGTTATITFEVTFKEFTVPGSVEVTVVSSTRPAPRAEPDGPIETRPSKTVVVPVLDDDFNPFQAQGHPLKVIAASLEQDVPGGTARVSFSSTDVTIVTGAKATGTLTAVYTIQDATEDPARAKQGRITLIIRNVPDAPPAPTATEGDGTATVKIAATASNNSDITGYTIHWGGKTKDVATPGTYTIGGLANGTSYTFTVTATNGIGTSTPSGASNAVRPFGAPSAPSSASLSATSNGSGDMSMSWGAPSDNGGRAIASYDWRFTKGSSASGSQAGRSRGASGGIGTTYQFEVRACNTGGKCSGWTRSNQATPTKPPPPEPSATPKRGDPASTGTCARGCYLVAFDYAHLKGGTYTVTVQYRDAGHSGWSSLTPQSMGLGSSGSGQTYSMLGTVGEHDEVRVRFQGPDDFYSSVSGAWG